MSVMFANIGNSIIDWFLALPDFTSSATPGLGPVESYTTAIAFALLGLMLTAAVIPAFAGGQPGTVAIQSIVYTAVAGILLVAWPTLYHMAVSFSDVLSNAIIESGNTDVRSLKVLLLWDGTAVANGFLGALLTDLHIGGELGNLLTNVGKFMMYAGAFMALGLFAMKIVNIIGMALIFAGMPLALAGLPIAQLRGGATTIGKIGLVLVLWPTLWSLCLVVFTAFTSGIFHLSGVNIFDELVDALASIALLALLIMIPWWTTRAAMGASRYTRTFSGIGGIGSAMQGYFMYRALSGGQQQGQRAGVRGRGAGEGSGAPGERGGGGTRGGGTGGGTGGGEGGGRGEAGEEPLVRTEEALPEGHRLSPEAQAEEREMYDVRHGELAPYSETYDLRDREDLATAWNLLPEDVQEGLRAQLQEDPDGFSHKIAYMLNDDPQAAAIGGYKDELRALGEAKMGTVKGAIKLGDEWSSPPAPERAAEPSSRSPEEGRVPLPPSGGSSGMSRQEREKLEEAELLENESKAKGAGTP